jgi:hypothetical protein
MRQQENQRDYQKLKARLVRLFFAPVLIKSPA